MRPPMLLPPSNATEMENQMLLRGLSVNPNPGETGKQKPGVENGKGKGIEVKISKAGRNDDAHMPHVCPRGQEVENRILWSLAGMARLVIFLPFLSRRPWARLMTILDYFGKGK